MRGNISLGLDHVALITSDLASSKEDYERLGFRLTRASSHKGRITPEGPIVPWGSGNHCAMFHRGYYEILGVTDPNLHHEYFTALASKYHGVQLIALECESAEELYQAWKNEVAGLKAPAEIGRDVPLGLQSDETTPGTFRIVHLDPDAFPEAELLFIEHATRDALWQEALLEHPNGVLGLSGVTVCCMDPDETSRRFERVTRGALAEGIVSFVSPDEFALRYASAVLPSIPCVAVVELAVRDLEATSACLKANQVTPHPGENVVWVRPERAGGVVLCFAEGE
ncbi:MAG TPA: VOC family protein [Vicinamibacteria bacterium]|nr:VOC family protein [Vicinamibacteria bacterium]